MKHIFTALKLNKNGFNKGIKSRTVPGGAPKGDGKDKWKKFYKKALRFSLYAGVVLVLFVIGVFAYYAKDLPSPDKINARQMIESTKIYDRTGEHLLYEVHGEEKRTLIAFEDIPETVRYATLALEDQDFYYHHGIKLTSILRSVIKDILHRERAQGGSTITQQFIKNSILTSEKSFTRKFKELILAIEIEQKFSKDEILRMYLNEIPYGSNAYGIEAAAQTFFGKSARELSLPQSCLLASLPQAPSRYSPYGSYPERLKARQEYCLDQMANLGYISQEDLDNAKAEDVLAQIQPHRESIEAPHFVMYIKDYLEETYGEDVVEKGGMKVYTTLDWDMQKKAEEIVKEGALVNETKWNAQNAALVAMDPKTGQILTMVGSRDYFDASVDGQVNVAIRLRQPGSSFKPYVYLTAFKKGYTPETTLFDVETNFETADGKDYTPQNYDGNFHGPLKIKEALGMSLNVPAVKTLYLAGVDDSIATAKSMGITSLNDKGRYGLSLVLGGGEIMLLDHVNAFGTLANGGVRIDKTAILKVEDSSGEILEKYEQKQGERVIEEKYVNMIDHIISTNKYRAPAFGENNPLKFEDGTVAAKTGTTNEFRDGWLIGYTPSVAVGVWTGNNDNSPMKIGAAGANTAGPIWRKFVDSILTNYTQEKFPEYKKEDHETGKDIIDGTLDFKEELKVCEIPGEKNYCLANKYCPEDEQDKKTFFNAHSILYYIKLDDPLGDIPDKKDLDPQYKNWEKAIEKWAEKNDYDIEDVPEDECKEGDFSKYNPEIDISVSYSNGSQDIKIAGDPNAPYGVDKVRFYIDGEEIGEAKSKPYSKTYTLPSSKNNSQITVQVKVIDKLGNEKTADKKVNISF